MVAQTSLLAFQQVMLSKELGDLQKMVLACLEVNGPLNSRMIAREIRKPINVVTPRVKELREHGHIELAFVDRDYVTNKKTMFWRSC